MIKEVKFQMMVRYHYITLQHKFHEVQQVNDCRDLVNFELYCLYNLFLK